MIHIRIKSHKDNFIINVPKDISIFELKEKIYEERGIYHGSRLIHKGRVLMDDETLEDYNIKNNDIILIMEQYVAGGPETENKDYSTNINATNKRGTLVVNIIIK